jgi:hypothetical protein
MADYATGSAAETVKNQAKDITKSLSSPSTGVKSTAMEMSMRPETEGYISDLKGPAAEPVKSFTNKGVEAIKRRKMPSS